MVQKKAQELIQKAIEMEASDIYLIASGNLYKIYIRQQLGRTLIEELNQEIGLALLTHFKFLAGMNTGERRRVQLGACWYELEGSSAKRLRLSTVGDFEGNESLVIRLLHDQKQELEFWFDDKLQDFRCKRGLYLFSGPVGSGKTSLMFDLSHRHFSNAQVITIEEPVELIESDFIQLQVNDVIGNSYDELIKLSLRHRPDLLIVGEIRDQQTARAVLRASLTGYTVFSTIHAASVKGVVQRLLELGLSDWELKNGLEAVVYQRLIAGKGVLDIAKSKFDTWSPKKWNEKIENLYANGHLTAIEAEREKISINQASKIDTTDGESFE